LTSAGTDSVAKVVVMCLAAIAWSATVENRWFCGSISNKMPIAFYFIGLQKYTGSSMFNQSSAAHLFSVTISNGQRVIFA
jgi:hypothetical protein